MKTETLLFGYRLSKFLFVLSLLMALGYWLYYRFHPGLWMLSLGLFFAIRTFHEQLKQKS